MLLILCFGVAAPQYMAVGRSVNLNQTPVSGPCDGLYTNM